MTTTARAVSGLDVSAPDAMDLHPDFDFGDGDIELDLDTARDDDDLSLHDADNSLDVQTVSADHDDFMADNEDLIEEDMNNSNDQNHSFNDQESLRTSVSQRPSLAPPDEDLLDYSDDEGMEQQVQNTNSYLDNPLDEGTTIQKSTVQDNIENLNSVADTQNKDFFGEESTQEEELGVKEVDQKELQPNHQDQNQDGRSDWEQDTFTADEKNESYGQGNEFDDQVTTQQEGSIYADEDVLQNEEQNQEQTQPQDQSHTEDDGQDQNDQEYLLPPVTVNYSGSEFWLFKQHDDDNSGDWLLEDISLAESELSHVFRACRGFLGQDITVEIELGFRFDHMHNMELYEDNTVCAYVTLQRLVNLYHNLMAQDDIAEPEPFYITLQFRPRFFTLLGEMEKYAQEGNGFMKLNSDIAAGQTHFSNMFSAESTEYGYEQWENEGQDGEQQVEENDGDDVPNIQEGDEPHDDKREEAFVEHVDEHDNEHAEQEQFDEHQSQGTNLERSPSQEDNEQHETFASHVDTANITSDAKETNQTMNTLQENVDVSATSVAQSNHESPYASGSHPDEGDDLIDYSDDEDVEHGREPEHSSRQESSTSSSTVQGEESLNVATNDVEEFTNTADPTESGRQSSQEYDGHDDEEDIVNDELSAQYADLDAPANGYHGQNYGEELYQEEDQAYNSPERLEAYEPNENQEYSDQIDQEGDTNEYYGNPEDQTTEDQIFPTLPVDAEDNGAIGAVDSATVDGLVDVEDFLNDGDATLPGLDDDNILSTFPEDEVDFLDPNVDFLDQDGVVDQAAVPASSVAEPIEASSVELQSPQGQKRTIDEVGNADGDASDLLDAKRPRV